MKPYFIYVRVSQEALEDAWIQAMPWIAKAIDKEDYLADLQYIQTQLRRGFMQLWAIQDTRKQNQPICFLITEIRQTPDSDERIAVIRWCSGENMFEWLEDIAILENLATQIGCTDVEVWGRVGWSKVLKPYGFTKKWEVLSKSIKRSVH